jgi:transposase
VIEPLLPEEPPKPKGARPRIDDRAALTGILFVLKSAIPWEMLPQEMGCGSGMTCSGEASRNGTKRACGRGCTTSSWIVWAGRRRSTGTGHRWTRQAYPPPGGKKSGANPTDKGKKGSKRLALW